MSTHELILIIKTDYLHQMQNYSPVLCLENKPYLPQHTIKKNTQEIVELTDHYTSLLKGIIPELPKGESREILRGLTKKMIELGKERELELKDLSKRFTDITIDYVLLEQSLNDSPTIN